MKQYFYALATFSGTIIGVGLFGLPFVTVKAGIIPVLFYFFLLGGLILISHLVYGEISLRTKKPHRLPGYAKIYLGKKAGYLSVISNAIGLFGANLAYIIIGGSFLANLALPLFGGYVLAYILIYALSGAFLIYLGSKTIARSEFFSLIIFFGILLFIVIKSRPSINLNSYYLFNAKNLFLPYGVILFSLGGISVIPEIREVLGERIKLLKNVIIVGTLIPILTYLIFIYAVVGVSGAQTTTDALTGLKEILGPNIILAGYFFGLLTTFTSYLTIGLTLKKIFWYDLNFSHFNAWVIACFIPIILYFLGLNDFIKIIGFAGAVALGVDAIITFLIYLAAKKIG